MKINENIIFSDIKNKINIVLKNKYINKIFIKEHEIKQDNVDNDIQEGIKQCIHDKYSDIDITIYFKEDQTIFIEDIGIESDYIDEKFNTNFHRYGYKEKLNYFDTYTKLDNKYCIGDENYNHIAKLIRSAIENNTQITNQDLKNICEI